MLKINDIRESRVYQEAKQEGKQEALREVIARLASKNFSVEHIASLLEIDPDLVKAVLFGK